MTHSQRGRITSKGTESGVDFQHIKLVKKSILPFTASHFVIRAWVYWIVSKLFFILDISCGTGPPVRAYVPEPATT